MTSSLNDAAGPFAVLLEGDLVARIVFGRRGGRLAIRSSGRRRLRIRHIVVAICGRSSAGHVISSRTNAIRCRVADVIRVGAVSFKFGSQCLLFLLAPFQIFFQFPDILPRRGRGCDRLPGFDHLHDDVSLAAQSAPRSERIIDPIVLYRVRAGVTRQTKGKRHRKLMKSLLRHTHTVMKILTIKVMAGEGRSLSSFVFSSSSRCSAHAIKRQLVLDEASGNQCAGTLLFIGMHEILQQRADAAAPLLS